MVRTSLAAVLPLLLAAACITTRVGPGVLRKDWNERPRDPDPVANPAAQYPDERWGRERAGRIPGPGESDPNRREEGEAADEEAGPDEGDSAAVDLGKRSLATALAAGFGWLPLVELSGTFEEDRATRARHRQRVERAEARKAERRKHRVDRAPAGE